VVPSYSGRFEEAVKEYWRARTAQKQKQTEAGRSDAGSRGAVTGGAQMGRMTDLVAEIFVEEGFPESSIHRATSLELPGYYRPERKWDLLVIHEDTVAAAIEFKSQVGPSFGNNFNNRISEAVGDAQDLWTAYREDRLGDIRPWLGYLFLLEDAPASSRPVKVREPFFEVDPVFPGTSYKKRYEIFCRRLVRERLYDAACFVTSSEDPRTPIDEPANDLSFARFAGEIRGRAKMLLEVEGSRSE
jgi:Restriction endonuclease XhoI